MNLNSIIPKDIKVGPYTFQILPRGMSWFNTQGVYGNMISDQLEINVVTAFIPIVVLDTLIHECLHAVYFTNHLEDKDDEERTVSTLATSWTGLLRDNPQFVVFQNQVLQDYHS